jgi:enediyne biosynthesis protein E4
MPSPFRGPSARHGRALVLVTCLGALALAGAALWPRLSRPAGEPTRPAGPPFADRAAAAGLNYRWEIPGKRPLNILQTIGNGCAFLDYNNDGNLDVLLVGLHPTLYAGDGKGHFTDVTAAAGLDGVSGHFLGCAAGDADGDGNVDLYLSGYRTACLLLNEGGRRFRDVTRAAGLPPEPWGTSCAFAETVPGSGRLDLYVADYAEFGPQTKPQLCIESGRETSCGPRYYHPLIGHLYRNEGVTGGVPRFRDVTRASGAATAVGRTLGAAFADLDGSGRPTLALGNDEMPGDLLAPVPGAAPPRYRNAGELAGTAYDRDGSVHGGMGVDWGDYDNDGRLDLFVATFQHESKSLYRNEGDLHFSDVAIPAGVGSPTIPFVAFGCKFFDYDNDGGLDLAIANGHVQDNIHEINSAATYRQAMHLFHNLGGSPVTFDDVSQTSGPDLMRPIVGRGLATGDLDNDGRVDLLVTDAEGAPLLLHNQGSPAGHWLGVRLVGTRANRSGYGALLTAAAGGRTLLRHCHADGSYLSSSDPRVHFGLGADRLDSLTIRWPGGRVETLHDLPVDRYVTVQEGRGRWE